MHQFIKQQVNPVSRTTGGGRAEITILGTARSGMSVVAVYRGRSSLGTRTNEIPSAS